MSPTTVEAHRSTTIPKVADMAYSDCRTRIVDLRSLSLPSETKTPDSDFVQLYKDYISANKSPDSPNHTHARQLASAVTSLTTGIAPPVAFPTETVYGLGADATNASSIAGIFAAKGRPSDNPLIVHVSSIEHLERCLGGTPDESAIPHVYHDLVREFWPGPLTILIPVPLENKGVNFASNVHPGQSTIGFRLPSSPYARFLMAVTDRPIAAPSANSSGKPSPTTAKHVFDDLNGKINFILDGGSCDVGVESTVVDGLGSIPLILRPGGLSKVELKRWGKVKGNIWANVENGWEVKKQGSKRRRSPDESVEQQKGAQGLANRHHPNGNDLEELKLNHKDHDLGDEENTPAPRAPGMKYKHYAPNARMFLVESSPNTSGANHEQTINRADTIPALHDFVADILQQSDFLPVPSPPTQDQNGDHDGNTALQLPHAASAPRSIVISVLTSTSWPDLVGLDFLLPGWHATRSVGDTTKTHLRLTAPTLSPSTIDVYSIDLGHESTTISNRLFAALRTCDDLRSDFILAEAPVRTSVDGQNARDGEGCRDIEMDGEDEFETVLERMRKAASEIISL